MSRRIPQAFIDELISRADIVDVIGHRVALKKAGSNYKGLCPFHDEKTPSFSVNREKAFYKCFGCGAGGNVISFLMAFENASFPEAVNALAETLGLEVPGTDTAGSDRDETAPLLDALTEADRIYRQALRESPGAIDYLKHRGIDGSTAARYSIGYAPDAWDTLRTTLGREAGSRQRLIDAGLLIRNEAGKVYDRFRDRIMFPIRDPRGRAVGFGGRALGDGEPKYLNSPETPVFNKSRVLYGLYEARQAAGRPGRAIVVEGYLDVVALAQHGIGAAVATMGTAATAHHIRQLTRLADEVVFCFDGDRAGRAAAARALETALPFGGGSVELKFLLLPDGHDPDSFVRAEGAQAFEALVSAASPLGQFMLDELGARANLDSLDGRAKLIDLARPLLARLPAGIYRQLIVGELARICGIDEERLESLLDAGPRQPGPRPATQAAGKQTLIRKAIVLVLAYPSAAARIEAVDGLDDVDAPGADLLRRLLETTRRRPQISPGELIGRFSEDPEGRYLDRLVGEVPLDDEQMAPAVLSESLERIVERDRRHKADRDRRHKMEERLRKGR
jgi:DNA primase